MPGEEGGKARGNHKEKKGKSSGGAPNPLAVIRGPVLIPKASAGAETKGASHTQALHLKRDTHVDNGTTSTKKCEAITNVAIRVMRLKRDG